jgi:hypothetical protein
MFASVYIELGAGAVAMDFGSEVSMRSRMLGTVLIAGAVAFAPLAWSHTLGGSHGGGGHSSTGGHGGSGHSPTAGHGGGGRPSAGSHGRTGHPYSSDHWGAGHPSAGRLWGVGHSPSAWHTGSRAPRGRTDHPHGNPHPSPRFHHYGHYSWRGFWGWGWGWDLHFGFPLWWGPYWDCGWPYGYYDYGAYGSLDSDVVFMPPDRVLPEQDASETTAPAADETTTAVTVPSPVGLEVSPPTALVYLNDVLIGSVEEFDGRSEFLYLDPGRYTLEFRSPGYHTRTVRLYVSDGNKTVVGLDLRVDPAGEAQPAIPPSPGLPYGRKFAPNFGPSPGAHGTVQPAAAAPMSAALEFRVSPAGAAIYLDDVLVGTADALAHLSGGVATTPGQHRIDVVAPGHAGKTLQIDAEAGQKQELSIILE